MPSSRSRSRRSYRTMSGGRVRRRSRRRSSTCAYTLPADRKTWETGPVGTFSTTASRCPKGSAVAGDGEDGKRWCCAFTQSVRRKYADTLVKKGMKPKEAVAIAVASVPNVKAARAVAEPMRYVPPAPRRVYGPRRPTAEEAAAARRFIGPIRPTAEQAAAARRLVANVAAKEAAEAAGARTRSREAARLAAEAAGARTRSREAGKQAAAAAAARIEFVKRQEEAAAADYMRRVQRDQKERAAKRAAELEKGTAAQQAAQAGFVAAARRAAFVDIAGEAAFKARRRSPRLAEMRRRASTFDEEYYDLPV